MIRPEPLTELFNEPVEVPVPVSPPTPAVIDWARAVILGSAWGSSRYRTRSSVVKLSRLAVVLDGGVTEFVEVDPLLPPEAAVAGGGKVIAPIPGRVADVLVAVGHVVVRGQVLVVMEAMKMEISLVASRDGVVVSLHAAVGTMIDEGTEVVVIGDAGS